MRTITEDDMIELAKWIRSNPKVPEGDWCKDFGTFKLVGHAGTPATFLSKDQPCHGQKIS
jgi:hypothetical protein